ncbi:hypothetical protein BF49_2083 [Bradyrhizobium sp.]|uniref:hypothetical protein n=1 Tax=Bradyrhizobium sp. TaxID=376 RepID=UPI0007C1E228|nr:hypothetical protein [Bradyrhizobium sp.]CUT11003.1 hypothetical protein BF49_2083 [Bradyrhizobium sp.]
MAAAYGPADAAATPGADIVAPLARNASWPPQMIGNGALASALDVLRQIDRQLKALTRSSEQQP